MANVMTSLKLIGECVPLPLGKNSHYTQQQTYLLLGAMSVLHWFAEGVSNYFLGALSQGDSLFYRLKKLQADDVQTNFDKLIRRNVKLARRLNLLNRLVWIAIDFHDREFYGKPNSSTRGSKQKNGTNTFYSYATASIVKDGCRLVIAQLPYSPLDAKTEVVKRLLDECQKLVHVEVALFDRGFFTSGVVRLLEERRLKYVMPAIRNPAVRRLELGVKQFPSTVAYELKGQPTHLVFVQVKGDARYKTLVFCTNILCWRNKLTEHYAWRWGIETGYRCVEDFAAKTCSTNAAVRLFLFYFAVALYNGWAMVNGSLERHAHVTGVMIRLTVLVSVILNALANGWSPP